MWRTRKVSLLTHWKRLVQDNWWWKQGLWNYKSCKGMGRVISSKIKKIGFLMPSFQFYFKFNNLKDKGLKFVHYVFRPRYFTCWFDKHHTICAHNDSIGILLQEIALLCGFKDPRCGPKLNWADWWNGQCSIHFSWKSQQLTTFVKLTICTNIRLHKMLL